LPAALRSGTIFHTLAGKGGLIKLGDELGREALDDDLVERASQPSELAELGLRAPSGGCIPRDIGSPIHPHVRLRGRGGRLVGGHAGHRATPLAAGRRPMTQTAGAERLGGAAAVGVRKEGGIGSIVHGIFFRG